MKNLKDDEIKRVVREGYGKIAKESAGGSSCSSSSCCGSGNSVTAEDFSALLGYSRNDLSAVPEGANMGLGCGNPQVIASMQPGETVLDLGSGGGIDCFLAARAVGESGHVIGVDMTPEMIEKARNNAKKNNIKNVEFRFGEIENLPVDDNSVDVVVSNCVINLSPDKKRVFQEIIRVLKPGGRIAISDIALTKELPEKVRKSIAAYVGCVGGAILIEEYKKIVEASGLKDVKITTKVTSACIDSNTKDPIGRAILDGLGESESLDGYVISVYVEGHK